jgi:RecA/RadA recombinase
MKMRTTKTNGTSPDQTAEGGLVFHKPKGSSAGLFDWVQSPRPGPWWGLGRGPHPQHCWRQVYWKTLLCIEGATNFAIKYPKGKIRYRECEAAFDQQYAAALGMPVDRVDFGDPLDTVEDLFEDMNKVIAGAKTPELYIVDSLDALSDRAELERDMDKGTFGAQKAKNLSQLFRRTVRDLSRKNVTVGIVSQVRSKIGISFGRDTTRSGGRALDFYASQVLFLAKLKTLQRTVKGMKRPDGIALRAKVDKLKVGGFPFREADFNIKFGYGIDDEQACEEYLRKAKVKFTDDDSMGKLRKLVEKHWMEIETSLLPPKKKYDL